MTKRRERGETETARMRRALPLPYRRACRLAERGRFDEARRLYAMLDVSSADPQIKALVGNDLAVLAALGGDLVAAQSALQAALASTPAGVAEQPLVADLLVHQGDDREVHGSASVEIPPGDHDGGGRKGPTTEAGT